LEIVYVLVKTKIGHEIDVMNNILKIDGVKEVMGTFGSYDVFVKILAPTRKEVEQVITQKVRKTKNILSTTTLSVVPSQGGK